MYLQILVFLLSYLLTLNAVFAREDIGKIISMTCPGNSLSGKSFSLKRNGKPKEIGNFEALFANDVLQVKDERCTMVIKVGGKEIKLEGKGSQRLRYVVIDQKKGPPTIVKIMLEFFDVWHEAVFGLPSKSIHTGTEKGTGKVTIPVFGLIENNLKMAKLIEQKNKLFLKWGGDLPPYQVQIKDNSRERTLCVSDIIQPQSDKNQPQRVVLSFSQPMFKAGNYYWVEVKSQCKKCQIKHPDDDCIDGGKFKAVKKDNVSQNQPSIDNLIQFVTEDNKSQWLFEVYQLAILQKKNNASVVHCRNNH